MTGTARKVSEDALALPDEERRRIAELLLHSLSTDGAEEIDAAWVRKPCGAPMDPRAAHEVMAPARTAPKPRPRLDSRAVVIASMLLVACRFTDTHPVEVESASRVEVEGQLFDSAIARARELGYVAHEMDERRMFASFRAHSGNFETQGLAWDGIVMASNVNYLMMQVLDGGRLRVWAAGPDVRGDKIDKVLQNEVEIFANRVAGYDVKTVRQ